MQTTGAARSSTKKPNRRGKTPVVVISIGCPAGIGPEVAVAAAARDRSACKVLVGDAETIALAARLRGVDPARLVPFAEGIPLNRRALYVHAAGPRLSSRDRRPGHPSRRAGAAQLAYVDAAYDLVSDRKGRALVTGPVSKQAIQRSGVASARGFIGHTEWLQRRDAAVSSVMCFASKRLTTSLVTTHLPLQRVPKALSPERVRIAVVELARFLRRAGHVRGAARIAVCSLNPHAGEGELFGTEEGRAIAPGVIAAGDELGRRARLTGPIGAETAYRKAFSGEFDGVVAMYHDQATIPMKLVAFGDAVNVTLGLSIVRTSVDHGTGYDIAWRGVAHEGGMLSALQLGARLVR